MLTELKKYKPMSIHDVIPTDFFSDDNKADYVWNGNCYEWYYAVAKVVRPKSFLEIGVRYGSSFLPTLLGGDELEYALGWDLETYGVTTKTATENIGRYYTGKCQWEILRVDSQAQTELPRHFDLVSIDGCHEFEGALHDLRLAMNQSSYVFLDDYDFIPEVRAATDRFLEQHKERIDWNEYVPTYRGSQLIKFLIVPQESRGSQLSVL